MTRDLLALHMTMTSFSLLAFRIASTSSGV